MMGSVASHIAAFLFLFPIGIRRLLSAYALHIRSLPPSPYQSKPWYFSSERVKNLDLYALLLSLPIAALSELFLFLTLPSSPAHHRLPFSHQSAALFLFWLLLLSISTRHPLLPDDLLFLLASLTFLAELFLTGTTADPAAGGTIEGRAYGLLSTLTLACAASCLVLSARRSAFAADVALSAGLALKGTWALQAGVCLFGLPPKGCRRNGVGLECELEEDRLRGVALIDLLFVVHAVGVAVGCLVLFGLVARSAIRRSEADLGSMMMRPIMSAEFEMD